jgi:hypothetical protein
MLSERDAPRTAVAQSRVATLETTAVQPSEAVAATALGWLPILSVVTALGFALVSAAYYASRSQLAWADPVFWIGITILMVPPVGRLLSVSASRAERIGLLLLMAIALYLVKVSYSPVAFAYPDEIAHQFNLLRVLQTGHLFQPNPALSITALYPGLASVSSAIATLTGLSDFHSGLVVVGAARVLLSLTLFLLVERLTHSHRVAGLSTALYAGNPNYLYWSAEFGYESLALPLASLVIFAALRRDEASPATRLAWTAFAFLAMIGVIITHHLTSYFLVVALWALVIIARLVRTHSRPAPIDLAIGATVGLAGWFALVASDTWLYLSGALTPAFRALSAVLTFQQAPRAAFDSTVTTVTPLWQQLLAYGAIVLIAIALPFGLLHLWRTARRTSITVMLGLAGLAYIPIQALRLTPGSWESANRSSEFLFTGVGLVVASALVATQVRFVASRSQALLKSGMLAYAAVILLGGVVVSWRPDGRLPRAYVTEADGQLVQPQGIVLAEWMERMAGPNNSVATDESNGLLLATFGQQFTYSGQAGGFRFLLTAPTVDAGVRSILTNIKARYVVVDRRLQSADHLVGIYPVPGSVPLQPNELIDPVVTGKWDLQTSVSRIADTGDIVVYDVSKLSGIDATSTGR